MKITIEEIGKEQEEEMILRCHELNTDMLHLLQSLKATKNGLVGIKGEEIHRLSLPSGNGCGKGFPACSHIFGNITG